MLRRLLPQGHVPEFTDPSGKVVIAEMPVSSGWIGRRMTDIEAATNGRLAYLTRLGDGMVPGPETVYQEGDLLHIALKREDLAIAERVLDAPPPAH
jgi:trk system potassium uptake protein TrkA